MSTAPATPHRTGPLWAGIALALLIVGLPTAAAAEPKTPKDIHGALRLSGTPVTMTVAPKSPAYWEIGITTAPITVRTLLGAVTATGPSGAPTHALTIALSSCTAAWQQASCPATKHRIVRPTPMNELTGTASPIAAAITIPAQLFLLAQITQPVSTAGPKTVAVTIKLSATGDDPTPARNTRTPTGTLAYTGTHLTLCALAAALSVTAGTLLARLAPRRTRRRRP